MPYCCDFALFHRVTILSIITVEFHEKHPALDKFMQEFEKVDGIKEDLNSRPYLKGMGVEPFFKA